jgi:CheY-like chemotaxis protein
VTAKRALIVDDSKSARVVLSRMLEEYAIEVDTAESAEDAIEYLKSQRPDVIFMDHLMPGMDGFQAVQAIKNDPRTAAIPIMMYTSQQGELYMGQARALGAIGVLPKQVAPTDVSKVLYQLHLLAERRDARPGAFQPVLSAAEQQRSAPNTPLPAGRAREIELQAAVEPLLKAQSTELRRFVVASLDSFAARVLGEMRQSLSATPVSDLAPPPHPPPKPLGWILFGALAAVALFVTLTVVWRQSQELEQMSARVASAERAAADAEATARAATAAAAASAASATPAAPPADSATSTAPPVSTALAPGAPSAAGPAAAPPAAQPAAAADSRSQSVPVPYGEAALSGARLDAIKNWITDLEHRDAVGTLRVTSYSGDFCLTGNPAEGYSLAPDDLPAKSCDLTGNPYDDALAAGQRESRPFTELQAALAARSKGALTIASVQAGRSKSIVYPQGADAMAAQWNSAAAANQRVELSFQPRAASP